MSWERFSYICRKANITLKSEESVSECISRVEGETSCTLYGHSIKKDSISRKILNEIGTLKNTDKAKKVLDVYGKIDLSQNLSEPMQLKRVTIYLAYVTFMFFVVSSIYHLRVTPSFLGAFETFGVSPPSHLLLYQDYWLYFVLLISLILAVSLIVGFTLRGLFQFKQGRVNGLILRFLAFKGIRASYITIIDVISFPALAAQTGFSCKNNKMFLHLSEINNSGMNLSVELQALIKTEAQSLLNRCEKQMRLIASLVAIIIIFSIFFFLVSAYSPIFVLGETV